MEGDGEIGERCQLLNTFRPASSPSALQLKEALKTGTNPQPKKESGSLDRGRRADCRGCLVQRRKVSQNGKLKEVEAIEFLIICLRWDKGNHRGSFLCLTFPLPCAPTPIAVQQPDSLCRFRLFAPPL